MWVPCEYWLGDSGGDGQPLLELSRFLAGRHGSWRNGHGDSAVDWNALLLLPRQVAGHPQVTRRTSALSLPLWIEGHPGVCPGGAQQGGKCAGLWPPCRGTLDEGFFLQVNVGTPDWSLLSTCPIWLGGFCSGAVKHGTDVAKHGSSESELGTFAIHVSREAVLQSFMKAFQKIGVCYSSING